MPEQLGHVRWDGFDHRYLWNMIMDAHPNDVFDRHERWTKLGASLTVVNETVQQTLNTLFGSWRGSAAVTAALGNTRVLNWAQDAAESIQQAGEQLGHYGNALVEARNRMPQPRHVYYERAFRAGDGATVLSGPENVYTLLQLADDQMYTLQERREAKQRAVEVMRAFEADAIDVTRRLAPIPELDGSNDPGGGEDVHVEPPPVPLPGPDGGAASTGAAGTNPSFAGAEAGPGGYGLGTGGPGAADVTVAPRGLAGPFNGGVAGPFNGGVAAGTGRAGRGVGALAGRGAAAEAAAAEAVAARGAAGTRGGATFYPSGGAGGREDDRDKPLAPYLVAEDDLFADDRAVAPPVFGA